MRWVADLVYLFAGIAYLPIALFNAVVVGKNRRGWGQRFGGVPRRDASKRRIWIHAVSLGEVNATPRLVEQLEAALPDWEMVISTTTDTGYARAVHFYGPERVFRFPLDFSLVVHRVLNRIRPTMIVLVELEVWYNLTRMAARRGIPVVVVNGRLTERSARRLGRLGPLTRSMFRSLKWVGAQDEAIAARFRLLGVPPERLDTTSSMKWDTAQVADCVEGMDALAEALGLDPSRPVWVCGSTGPGEEEMILEAFRDTLRHQGALARDMQGVSTSGEGAQTPFLVIVPRKPERFAEVAKLAESAGFRCIRRSDHPDGGPAPAARGHVSGEARAESVILGDTMGELRKFYALARVVFVGRSLVPMGGSDPMEVAALGKPVVVGPHTANFQLPIDALAAADAVTIVPDAEALIREMARLSADEAGAYERGRRAREVVLDHQGATRQTAEKLIEMARELR
jgi:3-deoxy-D-manno-octulosonic-acid transferase